MQRFLNNYETTLHAAINDTITSIQVYPSTAFDDVAALTGGDYYLLTISDGTNIEIVKATAVSVGPIHIITVERDVSSSGHGSFSFAAGASVKMSVVAETLQALNEQLMNADYPPNYTVNVQTRSTAGTVAVPFTPLVIQQVNIDVASGVTLNVTPGATWGECIITLYRTNLSHAWPALTYNGNVVPVAGDPPGSGNYNAKLLCRSEPGAGYLPNPFVTFEWITRAVAASASYQSPFGTAAVDQGLIYTGNTLTINPATQGPYHKAAFQNGTTLNIAPSTPVTNLMEVFIGCEPAGGWPTIQLFGSTVTPRGAAPSGSATILLHVVIRATGSAFAEWLTFDSAALLPFSTASIYTPVSLPVFSSGQTMTVNYQNGASTPTTQWAKFESGSSINFYNPGYAGDSAWSGIREFFIIIHALTTAMPTVKLNGATVTPAGTAPGIIPPPTFGVPLSAPAGMLKATIMLADGFHRIRAEWVLFQ